MPDGDSEERRMGSKETFQILCIRCDHGHWTVKICKGIQIPGMVGWGYEGDAGFARRDCSAGGVDSRSTKPFDSHLI